MTLSLNFLPDYALPSHGEREEWSAETDRGVRKIGKDRHEGSMSLKAQVFHEFTLIVFNVFNYCSTLKVHNALF